MSNNNAHQKKDRTILIITSELCNPDHLVDSIFELTQATHLSKIFNVAILSVNNRGSFESILRSFIKLLLRKSVDNYENSFKIIIKELTTCFFYLIQGRKVVHRHVIENITIYEGIGYSFRTLKSFTKSKSLWVKIGINAFNKYCSEHSKPKIIFAHGRFLVAGALALEIKQKYDIDYTYTEHCSFYREGLAPKESLPILSKIIENAQTFICVSKSLLSDVEIFLNHKFENALIIPVSLDKIFETHLKEQKSYKDNFVFTNIAFFHRNKRQDVLIKAFSKAFNGDPRYILNICGDGPTQLYEELVNLTKTLDIEQNVKFLGRKTKHEILDILDNSDSLVLSSKVETLGVVVLEALSRGLPVVATICGGVDDIIKDFCGIMVQPDDIDTLATALIEIVENYHKYDREEIRAYALKHFGSDAAIDYAEKTYNSIIEK